MHSIMYSNADASRALDNAGGIVDELTATNVSKVESGNMKTLYLKQAQLFIPHFS